VRNGIQNGIEVANVAFALAARLRVLAENLERVESVAAVFFTLEAERKGAQVRTSIEITLVEDAR
jgi:hypothetical protein